MTYDEALQTAIDALLARMYELHGSENAYEKQLYKIYDEALIILDITRGKRDDRS